MSSLILYTILQRHLRGAEQLLAEMDDSYLSRTARQNIHTALCNIETAQRIEQRKCSLGDRS